MTKNKVVNYILQIINCNDQQLCKLLILKLTELNPRMYYCYCNEINTFVIMLNKHIIKITIFDNIYEIENLITKEIIYFYHENDLINYLINYYK